MSYKELEDAFKLNFPTTWEDILEEFDLEILSEYLRFLETKNVEGGFFSKNDGNNILIRHVLESAFSIYVLAGNGFISRETKILDVGTGPGLPGFLFICLKESPIVTLMDSQRRKLSLLEEWWKQLKTHSKNLQFIYKRAEEAKGNFDLVVMRASIPYPFSAEIVTRLVKIGGFFCPFLAKEQQWQKVESEILSECGYTIQGKIELDELSFLGSRHIKVLKKLSQAKHGYPRDWKIISREIKEKTWEKLSP
ncbi:RsmG family class I SAM-dependent methyltransferase [Leptospira sp. GIMC2001]|uniref:RsmG family class I SAM-dependent methyltransferase n=1 Tax=Leptospira sp. GIMC2001 TaxID=1513297 RepID=UPI00234BB2DC|nr:RsmG family class I SAM-dependent methyltransferase [Leptospira sp. GIMC2001]WCL49517.1 class I SAM-dependent methyltransferase [Leptospira sp. GIMC2001]